MQYFYYNLIVKLNIYFITLIQFFQLCLTSFIDDKISVLSHRWIQEPSNWMVNAEEVPIICGNLTGARHCPPEWTCLCVGPNPNHGYTNFDNFLWSMLTTFQLITLDYWENVYNMVSFVIENLSLFCKL